ncbi:alpha/beta fold hydrolase [Streptosporangiaceae bacterium NEAU-GS5]|nr:alpha/beta fold hydrolase [Streptosporangiaceae bacterium NEAU-GS5]
MRIRALLAALIVLLTLAVSTRAEAATMNDWSCAPTAARPYPVVLVHGTFENMTVDWPLIAPVLKNRGYCVYALNYGGATENSIFQGTGDIAASAGQLAAFVDRVRAATGAAKVDIVGHSQGGMMPRYYMKRLGGAAAVHRLVAIAPSNHGTTLSGLVTLGNLLGVTGAVVDLCPACGQQIAGSDFIRDLNAGGETVSGVSYTVIATRWDEVVTPYTSAFLTGPGVANVTLQDVCPLDLSAHLTTLADPVVARLVLNSLEGAATARVNCLFPL